MCPLSPDISLEMIETAQFNTDTYHNLKDKWNTLIPFRGKSKDKHQRSKNLIIL